jgi:anti-sigma regulatory factor (Ser/Thr protein kinase)
MPLNLPPLLLEADPTSVRRARAWVREVLTRLDREDIVGPAELGVSELVTNAILHGRPPISVRVRGTRAHPRVEIRDASERPPTVNIAMRDEEYLFSTFGRGLGLVALHAVAWGAELTPHGKVVWFEPSDEPPEGDLAGEVFDLDQTVEERITESGLPDDPIHIRLLDMPVALYRRFRMRYYELGRELRLLSLAHGDAYPVARELAEVFLDIERERRLTYGAEQLDDLLGSDRERGDVDLLVPRSSPDTTQRLLDSLERADVFCREQRLLVLAATPLDLEMQRWYLGEVVRQAAGEPARPWPGPFRATDEEVAVSERGAGTDPAAP